MTAATAGEQAAARKRLAEVGGAARHEARHVAACVLLGIPVMEASAVPQVKAGEVVSLGHVDLTEGPWEYEAVRDRALVSLVGHMGDKDWPPPHPSHPSMQGKTPKVQGGDADRLWKAIDALAMDEISYEVLCQEAREMAARRDFKRLEIAVTHLLEQGHIIGPHTLEEIRAITQRESKTLRASTSADEDGDSFAVLADVSLEPGGSDRIAKGAFDWSIKRWHESGHPIPLHWEETPSFRYPVGTADPSTLRKVDGGWLFFKGSINPEDGDREHRIEAGHAWTAVKADGVRLELDYMVLANDEDDRVRTLEQLDLTGFTLRPTSEGRAEIERKRATDLRELRRKSDELMVETALGCSLDELRTDVAADPEPEPERVPTEAELRAEAAELGVRLPPRRDPDAEWIANLFPEGGFR